MAEIALEGIEKRFPDGTHAIQPTDLRIRDGELFVLVGPSGCGKSTLLRIIVGLESPTSGHVRVDGAEVTGQDPKDRNMAMVFQNYAIYPHMTVRENMAFPLKLAEMSELQINERVEKCAAILELDGLLERKPAELSGGQRQRVAMGRAIVRQPVAFLLDEPLSNLDAKLRGQMRAELIELQRRLATTTVYVTHDQTEAMTLGHRIAVLRKGRIQQIGTPREVYNRPANLFVAGFVGSPPMNFLPAIIERDRLVLPMTEIPLPDEFRGRLSQGVREVVAGVRPENFVPCSGSQEVSGTFSVVPEVIEWLGFDVFVHFDVKANVARRLGALQRELGLSAAHGGLLRLAARLRSDSGPKAGESLRLCVDPCGLHLFDTETGVRISAGVPEVST
jgi:multiple sugar transport system ATP-binding protein